MKENKDFNEYYKIEQKLGRVPRFGIIYNAIKKKTNEIKAIKIMEKEKIIKYLNGRGIGWG